MTEEQKFISECMSELKGEFPDEKQRYAVCKSKWDRGARKMVNNNELLIFPKGRFFVEKYNEWFDFNDAFFDAIIDTFKNSSLPKPFIDIDHNEGESFGEIVDLYKGERGLIGKVELNEDGKNILKQKKYRYISPSWGEIVDNANKKWANYLKSVSLTNMPALMILQPLSEQVALTNKEVKMKKISYDLSQVTDDAVKKLIDDLIAQGEAKEEIIASLNAKIFELQKEIEGTKDENEALKNENNAIKQEAMNREAEEFVKKQVENKKIEMSLFDYWLEQYKIDKEKTQKYFDLITLKNADAYKLSTKFNLTEEDILIMKSVKLNPNDEKDVEFYLKVNKKN